MGAVATSVQSSEIETESESRVDIEYLLEKAE